MNMHPCTFGKRETPVNINLVMNNYLVNRTRFTAHPEGTFRLSQRMGCRGEGKERTQISKLINGTFEKLMLVLLTKYVSDHLRPVPHEICLN